jgi:hypothetical protein
VAPLGSEKFVDEVALAHTVSMPARWTSVKTS